MIGTLVDVLLGYDNVLQMGGAGASIVGVLLSVYLLREARRDGRMAARHGAVAQIIARSHIRSQAVILTVQLIFLVISLLVWTLPPLPSHMGSHTDWIVIVIGMRKIGRAAMIVLLMGAGIRQAADRRAVLALVRAGRGA